MHLPTRSNPNTHRHAHTHTHTKTHKHTHKHTHTHTHTHTRIHIHTQRRTHAHTHTHTGRQPVGARGFDCHILDHSHLYRRPAHRAGPSRAIETGPQGKKDESDEKKEKFGAAISQRQRRQNGAGEEQGRTARTRRRIPTPQAAR